MRVLATILLMVSLLAMSVTVAGADLSRPACASQLRADDVCYAAGLPGGPAEKVAKPGLCLTCLVPLDEPVIPQRQGGAIRSGLDPAAWPDARRAVPWRPPRA